MAFTTNRQAAYILRFAGDKVNNCRHKARCLRRCYTYVGGLGEKGEVFAGRTPTELLSADYAKTSRER